MDQGTPTIMVLVVDDYAPLKGSSRLVLMDIIMRSIRGIDLSNLHYYINCGYDNQNSLI